MEPRIGMEIRVLSKYIGRYLDNIHDIECTLSGPQGLILIYLCEADKDVFQRDIEKQFNIRRSTATGLLNTLEKNGFIIKESVENDARLKKLIPSSLAYETVNRINEHVHQLEQLMLDGISKEELDTFRNIINKMKTNLIKE